MTDELLQGEVNPDRLSRSDWFHLVWGFLWRGVLFVVASGLAGFVLGFVVGCAHCLLASSLLRVE